MAVVVDMPDLWPVVKGRQFGRKLFSGPSAAACRPEMEF
jgi:hypothetical protein